MLEENGLIANEYHDESSGAGARDNDAGGGSEGHGQDARFQPSYNLAPGYRGIVCRPVRTEPRPVATRTPRGGHGQEAKPQPVNETTSEAEVIGEPGLMRESVKLQLQVMKWGLIPSWMQKRPNYVTMLKTINCRADTLASGKGMWTSMRGRKRCVVIAEGFYEWLKTGPKERVPHYIRRRDGLPLLFAGLWDCVALSETGSDAGHSKEKLYTYTIITTDSNAGLRFLHDRMPVIFGYNSSSLRAWLDPWRTEWTSELQALLQPWPHQGEDDGASLVVDIVSKEVNKVGHNSSSLIMPVSSENNKMNIATFFKASEARPKPPFSTKLLSSPVTEASLAMNRKRPAGELTTPPKRARVGIADKPGQGDDDSGFVSATRNKQAVKRPENKVEMDRSGSQKITSFFGLKNDKKV